VHHVWFGNEAASRKSRQADIHANPPPLPLNNPTRSASPSPPQPSRRTYPAVAHLPSRVDALGVHPLHRNSARKDIGQVGNVAAKDVLVQRVVDGPTPAAASRGQAPAAYSKRKREKEGRVRLGGLVACRGG